MDGVGTDGLLLCSNGMTSCHDVNVICIYNDLPIACSHWFMGIRGMAFTSK